MMFKFNFQDIKSFCDELNAPYCIFKFNTQYGPISIKYDRETNYFYINDVLVDEKYKAPYSFNDLSLIPDEDNALYLITIPCEEEELNEWRNHNV